MTPRRNPERGSNICPVCKEVSGIDVDWGNGFEKFNCKACGVLLEVVGSEEMTKDKDGNLDCWWEFYLEEAVE